MYKAVKRVGSFAVAGALLVTTGCSVSSQYETKQDQILADAKKGAVTSMKAEFAKSIEGYGADYLDLVKRMPNSGNGDFAIKVDAGDQGKASFVLAKEFTMEKGVFDNFDEKTTLLEVLEAGKSVSNLNFGVDIDIPANNLKFKGDAEMSFAENEGVIYMKFDDVAVSEIPGIPAEQFDAITAQYLGKWFKFDVAKVFKEQPLFKEIANAPFTGLNGVDPKALIALHDAYMDEVVLANDWLTVGEKVEGEGEVYHVTLKKEQTKKLMETSYDFLEKNIEEIDAVLKVSKEKNPVGQLTLAEMKKELKDGRADFMKEVKAADIQDLKFKASFGENNLKALIFDYELPKNAEAKGDISATWNFENSTHSVAESNIEVRGKITPKNEIGVVTVTADLNKKEGSMRTNSAKINLDAGVIGKFMAGLLWNVDQETGDLKTFKADMDLTATQELQKGLTGMAGEIKYEDGAKAKVSGFFKSKPDAELFDMKLDGAFSVKEGTAKSTFVVNSEADKINVSGDASLGYSYNDVDYTFELPEGADEAQDLTPLYEQFMKGFEQGLKSGAQR